MLDRPRTPKSRSYRRVGRRLILALTLGCLPPRQTAAADLDIAVEGVAGAAGEIVIGLFADPTGFPGGEAATRFVKAPAANGTVHSTIPDLPAGRYGVAVYHDANRNGRLDTGLFGIPTEGHGFGNGARGWFGPPAFDAAAIEIEETGAHIAVRLTYWIK